MVHTLPDYLTCRFLKHCITILTKIIGENTSIIDQVNYALVLNKIEFINFDLLVEWKNRGLSTLEPFGFPFSRLLNISFIFHFTLNMKQMVVGRHWMGSSISVSKCQKKKRTHRLHSVKKIPVVDAGISDMWAWSQSGIIIWVRGSF